MFKKVFSLLLCFILVFSLLTAGMTVKAETLIEKGVLTVDTVDGLEGESVYVSLKFTENPGLMGVSISVNYDPEVLTYEEYIMGDILTDSMVNNRPDKKYIRLVSLDLFEKKNDGTLITLKFKIKEGDVAAGLSKITVTYNKGDFCNQKLEKLMPQIVSGGVNVTPLVKECKHSEYGEWTTVAPATCEKEGVEQRLCKECSHPETRTTAALGHSYSSEWTVDLPATAERDGTMSRYCIRCDSFVDRVSFSLEQTEDEKIDNTYGSTENDKEYAEEIFKDQNPDKELTPADPESSDSSSATNSAGTEVEGSSTDPLSLVIIGVAAAFVALIAVIVIVIIKKKK